MEGVHIGFIGQGYIGGAYADDFEDRGFSVTRYTRSEPYVKNKDKIKECDFVFIAVPTPTTPKGFDDSVVDDVLSLVGTGKVAVIKSTLLPGTTEKLQAAHQDIVVLHSPEFLRAATAQEDARHPHRNVVGVPQNTPAHKKAAEMLIDMLPKAEINSICTAREAEITKYTANCFLYTKVIYFNLIYDLAEKYGADFETIRNNVVADPRITDSHTHVVDEGGRGAGGFCFIKDLAALRMFFEKEFPGDKANIALLSSLEQKNIELLRKTKKDIDLLDGVYGKEK